MNNIFDQIFVRIKDVGKFMIICFLAAIALVACKYDDTDLWNSVDSLNGRIKSIEETCRQANQDIRSLQTLVNASQNKDYITSVIPVISGGEEIGYSISFAKSESITILHGKDGDVQIPMVSVKRDVDNNLYWSVNNSWILDDNGNKIRVCVNDGLNGKDGITPVFKIENNNWYVSYDSGKSWIQLGSAVGANGNTPQIKVQNDKWFVSYDNGLSWEPIGNVSQSINSKPELKIENGLLYVRWSADDIWNEVGLVSGINGKDGLTPQLKIVDGEWFVSYDGSEWIRIETSFTEDSAKYNGPQLRIEDNYWEISYDDGKTWKRLGKATGEKGKDGESLFKGVTQDELKVYFELSDGTIIEIPKTGSNNSTDFIQFEDPIVKALCMKWDKNSDGELSYEEAAAVKNIGRTFDYTKLKVNITRFKELKYFVGLNSLDSAFMSQSLLTEVAIPEGVTSMVRAFYGCNRLYRVKLPQTSENISYAFYNCTYLTYMDIPLNVVDIEGAFWASSLQNVKFLPNSKLTELTKYCPFRGTKVQDLKLPASVVKISGTGLGNTTGGSGFNLISLSFEENSKFCEFENTAGSFNIGLFPSTLKKLDISNCDNLPNSFFCKENFYNDRGNSATGGAYVELDELKIKNLVPPVIKSTRAYGAAKKVYVPISAIELYKEANYWKEAEIIGY